jgi:hypothetical protein
MVTLTTGIMYFYSLMDERDFKKVARNCRKFEKHWINQSILFIYYFRSSFNNDFSVTMTITYSIEWKEDMWSTTDIPNSFIGIIILFDEGFKYGDGAKFRGYVGTNVESLCVEFWISVQCNIFENYVICYFIS